MRWAVGTSDKPSRPRKSRAAVKLCFSDYLYRRVFSQRVLAKRAEQKWANGYGEAQVLLTKDEYREWRRGAGRFGG